MENDLKKQQDKKDLDRIIDRMIRHYKFNLAIEKATGGSEEKIKQYKGDIRLLEDLRNGKLELK